MKRTTIIICILITAGCGTARKIGNLKSSGARGEITLANDRDYELKTEVIGSVVSPDTLTVTGLNGEKLYLMKSVVDSAGNVYGSENLSGVVITARFKNIAERGGKVDIAFDVHIPEELQDPSWQLRFRPNLFIQGDTIDLEDIYVTGAEYRESQLKGYEQYAKFLSSIITDSTKLRYQELVELFIARNIPTLAALKNDTSAISETYMSGLYDVSYRQVLDYYERRCRIGRNNHRSRLSPQKYRRYIRSPYSSDPIRLDTIITTPGNITYCYTQSVNTRAGLRKVEVTLDGEISRNGETIYTMPEGEPLTFYISSVSTFMEPTTRYINKIIERRAQANTQAYIDFEQGKWDIDPSLHENMSELERIRKHMVSLLNNETFDMDSLVITASCSPEGPFILNQRLAAERARAIKGYFADFAGRYQDSLSNEERNTIYIDATKGGEEFIRKEKEELLDFRVHSISEDWERLTSMVEADTALLEKEIVMGILQDRLPPDEKEAMLQKCLDYRYLREVIYPKLRTVQFDFHLHRKGMVKDTVHTTVPDENYANGLECLENREYKKAIEILRPYRDINTAVAYLSLDYNASAREILQTLPPSAKRDYMMAIIHAREGDEQKSVQAFIHSVEKDPAMKFRANLDPEISQLVKKYGVLQDNENTIY
jgi:hypothetical protein